MSKVLSKFTSSAPPERSASPTCRMFLSSRAQAPTVAQYKDTTFQLVATMLYRPTRLWGICEHRRIVTESRQRFLLRIFDGSRTQRQAVI